MKMQFYIPKVSYELTPILFIYIFVISLTLTRTHTEASKRSAMEKTGGYTCSSFVYDDAPFTISPTPIFEVTVVKASKPDTSMIDCEESDPPGVVLPPSLVLPGNLDLPKSQKQLDIIEKTAAFTVHLLYAIECIYVCVYVSVGVCICAII